MMPRLTIFLSVAALAGAGCAAGQTAPVGWQAAAEQVTTRLNQAETDRTRLPRLANPADAALLRAVFDLDAIWAMDRQPFPDIAARCAPVRYIGRRYDSLGTPTGPDGWSIAPDKRVMRDNWVRYHDELSLSAAGLLLCITRETQAFERFAAALPADQHMPVRRNAAIDGRKRTTGQLLAQLSLQTEGRGYTSIANRRLLLDAFAKAAPAIAGSLTIEQRATIRAAIDRALPGLSASDRATLAGARIAFESTRCTGLCAG